MIKLGKLLSVDDSGDYTFCNVSVLGKEQKALLFNPYGVMSNPPKPSMGILFSQQGQESNQVAMFDDPKNRPLKDLEDGEFAIGNYITGAYLFFNANGDCVVKIPTDFIADAKTFELNGNGDNLVMWSALNTQLQSFITAYNNHTHGGSVVPDSSFTLNITGARADTLKTDG